MALCHSRSPEPGTTTPTNHTEQPGQEPGRHHGSVQADHPRRIGHLDWTRDRRPSQYYAHKLNIAMHGPEAVAYNAADPNLSTELAARPGVPAVPVESWEADGWIVRHGERLFPRDAFPLRGTHNTGNLCVAHPWPAVQPAIGPCSTALVDTGVTCIPMMQRVNRSCATVNCARIHRQVTGSIANTSRS